LKLIVLSDDEPHDKPARNDIALWSLVAQLDMRPLSCAGWHLRFSIIG